MSIFSMPIMNGDRRIGTGYLLYDISKDQQYWGTVHSAHLTFNRLLIHDGEGRLYDLETGEETIIPAERRADFF